jgi:hypothetical protein
VVIMLVLAGLSAQSADAKSSVPFKASVVGTLAPTGPGAFHLTGAGRAIHLGNVKTYVADVQITGGDPVNGPLSDVLTETLTAANGDTITIVCQQVATPVSPGSPVLDGTDTWTVVGGTGRFSDASGSGTGHTHADLGQGTFTKEMTGSISY